MIPFCRPTTGQEEIEAVSRVIQSGMMAHGQESHAFEEEFAKFVGVRYTIFTNSCTSALKIGYKWLEKQDQNAGIIYPENTFCATRSAAREVGLSVLSRPTWESFEQREGWHRVNVHYAGIKDETPCLIEDSAHRIEPNDLLVGKIRCYSFHPTKVMTTGHGGMLVTNDQDIYKFARLCNDDGIQRQPSGDKATWNYQVELESGGYDGSDVNAALGREQLKKLPSFLKRRQEILDIYNQELGTDWQGKLFYVHFLPDFQTLERFITYMSENGIGTSYHYPNTGWLGVSLPLYPFLTNNQVQEIIAKVKAFK